MAWSYVGGAVSNSGTSNLSSLSTTLPTWSAGTTGTILFLAQVGSNTPTCTTPAGFTLVGNFIANSASRMYLFRKAMADADSGASVAAAWSASNRLVNAAVVVSGADWDAQASNGSTSGSSITVPGLTAGGTTGVTVAFYGGRTGTGTTPTITAHPSGYSNGQQTVSASTGSRNVLVGSSVLGFSGSATIAATSATASESLNSRAAWTVTLLETAPGAVQRMGWGILG